jgi:hypothetical protein
MLPVLPAPSSAKKPLTQMCVSTPMVRCTEGSVSSPMPSNVSVVCGKPPGTYKTCPGCQSRITRDKGTTETCGSQGLSTREHALPGRQGPAEVARARSGSAHRWPCPAQRDPPWAAGEQKAASASALYAPREGPHRRHRISMSPPSCPVRAARTPASACGPVSAGRRHPACPCGAARTCAARGW